MRKKKTKVMTKTNKYFPIKTESSCKLKWAWSTLFLFKGGTSSCHRAGASELDALNFKNFHNTDKKKFGRSLMMDGKWPEDGCEYCKGIEQLGGTSDRMLHNGIPNQIPHELKTNVDSVSVTPTILEIYFNNVCNLSCIYCVPESSSKINAENKKFGEFNKNGVKLNFVEQNPNYDSMLGQFWEWMEENSKHLERFMVLGGEPLYQTEFYKCLEYFDKNPHPNLELSIITNLMVDKDKLQDCVDKFKKLLTQRKIKRVDITCSIDCWGDDQEYVRYGINLKQWEENFELLLENKWITININQIMSILTIKTAPMLFEKLKVWRTKHPIGHYFSEIASRVSYMKLNTLGGEVFKQDFEAMLKLMDMDDANTEISKQYMSGILSTVNNSQPNVEEIKKLVTFLDEIDRRRNLNWKETFPWLEKEINNVV